VPAQLLPDGSQISFVLLDRANDALVVLGGADI
jgi:hypothetical protein